MPTYRVTDSHTGKIYNVTGDGPPTEQELTQLFGQAQAQAAPQPAPWRQGLSRLGHDVLPVAGGVIGGLAAGGAATPETLGLGTIPAAAAGSALGYAGGGRLAEGLDRVLGVGTPETLGGAFQNTARDLAIGAPMGIAGPELQAGKSLLLQGAKTGALVNAAMGSAGRTADVLTGNAPPQPISTELTNIGRDVAAGGAFGLLGAGAAKGLVAGEEAALAARRALKQGRGAGGAVKSAVGSLVPQGLPGKILQKAARIPESNLSPAERAARYEAIAENGGTFDEKGYDIFHNNLRFFQKRVEDALKPYNNVKVGGQPVVEALEVLRSEAPYQANPQRFLRAIDKRVKLYQDTPTAKSPFGNMTIKQAQKLKVQRNRDLRAKFDRQQKSFVDPLPTEDMMVLDAERSALKGLIEKSTGDANIRELNAQEGRLLSAGQLLTRAISKAENTSNLSAFHLARHAIAGTAGGVAGGPVGGTAGVALSAAATPVNLSKAAVALQGARRAYLEGLNPQSPYARNAPTGGTGGTPGFVADEYVIRYNEEGVPTRVPLELGRAIDEGRASVGDARVRPEFLKYRSPYRD